MARSSLIPTALTLLAGLSLLGCTKAETEDSVVDSETTVQPGLNLDATQTLERDSGATVVVYDFGDLWVHNYNDNPANGIGNATYVVESESSLVLIDAHFFPESAAGFRAYADSLGKPIDRILITHGHPDHVSGLASSFDDVPSYSSAGVISEALADSGSVIENTLGASAEIDGVNYSFEVRTGLEASEQVIITLPDYGVVALGDLFYNKHHAVMNPGFDGRISALGELGSADQSLFLAGHGPAATELSAVTEAMGYLETGRDTYATAADGEEFTATMLAAYPDYAGPFLLQLSVDEILYPAEE